MYVICSNNVNVRCAVGIAVKPYGYIDDASVNQPRVVIPYTVEHLCDCADLLDEIHNAQTGN